MTFVQGWLVLGMLAVIAGHTTDERFFEYAWGFCAVFAFGLAILFSWTRPPR